MATRFPLMVVGMLSRVQRIPQRGAVRTNRAGKRRASYQLHFGLIAANYFPRPALNIGALTDFVGTALKPLSVNCRRSALV